MAVDASAVARVVGLTTEFKDLRGGAVLNLPQHIAVFAQGSSDAVFSTDKWRATSAGAAGAKYGFGSPIHLALRELMPANGDGVGSIPVTVYPLTDDGSGVAASGDITPSGTATEAAAYRVRVAGILSEEFVIAAGAMATAANLTAACREIGEAIRNVLEMPVNVTYDYGTVTASALTGTGNGTLTAMSVTGAAIPGNYTLTVVSVVANGGVWELRDPYGTLINGALTMTPGVGAATVFNTNTGGLQFTITDGTTDFGLGASFTMTVPATSVNLVSKWKGLSANDLVVEVLDTLGDLTFAVTQPAGGLVNPSVADAIARLGTDWTTMVLNCLNIEDTTNLDRFKTEGDGRWGTLVHAPFVVFTGNTHATVEAATAVCSTRRTDKVNAQLVAPGSPNLPLMVAARQLARIAKVANDNPPTNYNLEVGTGLIPGTDGDQWAWSVRDQAVKLGSSTVEIIDGEVALGDVVTFYRPQGEEPPAYRYVVDIVKLQNIIFNIRIRFETKEWAGAPLLPDDQPTSNSRAKKPKHAKATLAALVDSLGLNAIIADTKFSKSTIFANISPQNPKRLDTGLTVKLASNAQIIDIGLAFGFFFGQAAVAA
jgi:phage tail sheath gpL-like